MNTLSASASLVPCESTPKSALMVFKLLEKVKHGMLRIELPNQQTLQFGHSKELQANIQLNNWDVFSQALKSGDIGVAESFIQGHWNTPDLTALIKFMIANRECLDQVIHGSWWGRLAYRLRHWMHRNTKTNSKKNIHAHYDLGNAFYAAWLDPSMNYSSAWFNQDFNQSLECAQDAKIRRSLQSVQLQPGDRLLEIGCGWGSLAEKAVIECGANVTGVTLSTEQLSWAKNRLEKLPSLRSRELRLQDYRDIDDEPFDAICSIEMFEAVGQAYWSTYFEHVARLLKKGGRACIQSIVIRDDLFDRYIESTDFIQQYIFPGGCLPSPSQFEAHAAQAGLKIIDRMAFGKDYAETCRRWRSQFMNQQNNIMKLGFDERFMRIWQFYLSYCEAGFDASDINVMQFTLTH